MGSWREEYRASLKSMDTEEHIDLAFYRPIGFLWAKLAARLGVTPNAITIASIFLGIGAGVAFYYPQMWVNLIGILLLVWANSFDSADGQLARMTHQYSRWGRILDGLSGDFWFVAIYIAIVLRENRDIPFFHAHGWIMWGLAVTAGLFHAKQAAMADYYRQFHLYILNGSGGSELDSSSDLCAALNAPGMSMWRRLTARIYLNYTREQEASSPAMQAMRAELRRRFPDGRIPARFRSDFREASLPLMKYTNILTFNWRSIGLFASILAGYPWLYFVYELVVLNNILLYMVIRHEGICRYFTRELENGAYKGDNI
ncbi:MAG: CDP-alcohol phosphatidyltransferase family protein [Muribaculaceae bacterium]|nr:CDP-alcohol phosphatidyltransferase family protein [Muribaculaceae bacterium]